MWEAKSKTGIEFVYILRWPNEQAMKAQWDKFMADEEWAQIKRETAAKHGELGGEIDQRVMRLTAYSERPSKNDTD